MGLKLGLCSIPTVLVVVMCNLRQSDQGQAAIRDWGRAPHDRTPHAGMPEVKAVDRDVVRAEFFRLYPGDAQKAKSLAFLRWAKDAVERGVVCSINVVRSPDLGQTIFWTP